MKNWLKAIAIVWGWTAFTISPLLIYPEAATVAGVLAGLVVVLLSIFTYFIKEDLDDWHET